MCVYTYVCVRVCVRGFVYVCMLACVCVYVTFLMTVAIKARQGSGQALRPEFDFCQTQTLNFTKCEISSLRSNKSYSIRFTLVRQSRKRDDVVDFYCPSKSLWTVYINKQAWIASINGRVGKQCETGPLAEGCIGSCCLPPPLPLRSGSVCVGWSLAKHWHPDWSNECSYLSFTHGRLPVLRASGKTSVTKTRKSIVHITHY